ncbi:MAG: sulfatase-like hydrolase/transferase [Eubacteriales bacterium]|nr:sulfatase-like hydrolase/transferase [Eubacteriales bacterium]
MKEKRSAPQSNRNKNQKKRKSLLGIRNFFRSKAGRNFLLVMEGFLAAAFFATPSLYYNGNVTNFFQRFYADSLSICGILFAILVYLTIKRGKLKKKTNAIITNILLFGMPFFAFLWLELYNNEQFWVPIFRIPLKYFLLNLALYYVIFYLILFFFGNVRNASIVMMILTALCGFLNYELTVFRSMSFIASDIFSFLTAISVANTYQLQMDVDSAEFLLGALVIVAALLKLKKVPFFKRRRQRVAYFVGCVMMCALVCHVYVYSTFLHDIGVDFRVYRPQYKYRYYGTLLTTARTFGYLHVTEPDGYSVEKTQKIIDDFANGKTADDAKESNGKKAEKAPNVIVIMNESFADLKDLGDLQVSQDYMPYFRSLKNTIKGYTYSSVFGGNTANSEFEFLTGNTLAFLPDNSVPYQLFLRNKTAGLTSTLKDQGYGPCYALHPYYNTGYSRYKIYPLMGFDHFYCSDDFSVFTDTVNYHITDYEDYRKLISLYESDKEDGKPFYMFNVTMQNHGSYDGSTYETGDDVKLEGSLRYFSRVEQYLNMIKMSDDALKYLVEYFEKVEEPTVIVFFGDHQPDLDEEFYNTLLQKDISELEGEELERLYKCPFLIWANYDIKDQYVERTSNNYLSTYLAEVTGMEKTGYLDYLTELRQKIPCINALGYWGDDGNYYNLHDQSSPYYSRLKEYSYLEYNNLFGKEEQISSFFYLNDD